MKSLLALILMTASVAAQEQSFWKANRVLITADAAAKIVDGIFTRKVLTGVTYHNGIGPNGPYITWLRHGYEGNPVARPFVKTDRSAAGFFAASFAGDLAGAYLLHRTGHHKLEKIALLVGIGYSVEGAAASARVYYTF